jgi:hypothetical protein
VVEKAGSCSRGNGEGHWIWSILIDRMTHEIRYCERHGEVRLPRFGMRSTGSIPIMLEIIPPPITGTREKHEAIARHVGRACASLPLAALNIPEVRNESRNGPRDVPFIPKLAPRQFAVLLRRAYREAGANCPEIIVNRCVPYLNARSQREWFQRTHDEFGIHSYVLVGGETSKRRYPGPNVPEAAHLLKRLNFPSLVGGITIPSRRKPGEPDDEPLRMLTKSRAGIQFFTTQILMEADSACALLRDYCRECEKQGVSPETVFLSVAPLAHKKDLEFLKWLDVVVPEKTERHLLRDAHRVEARALDLAEEVIATIVDYTRRHRLNCPLGVLVEHVMRRNFDLSVELTCRIFRLVGGGFAGARRSVTGGVLR